MIAEFELTITPIGGTVETLPNEVIEKIIKEIRKGNIKGMVASHN